MLKPGQTVPLLNNRRQLTVESYIAGGGQGEVYKVSYGGKSYALKWYGKTIPSDAFYQNIQSNIKLSAPNDSFLWPMAVTGRVNGRFGYVMPLKPEGYADYGDYLLGTARFGSYNAMFSAALNITAGFMELHGRGYSYQDINEGSFFIRPDGEILICDTDNTAPFGVNLGVKGTPKYMAPEVTLGLKAPDTHTDRFSLAVILFRLFYIDHPLEGAYTIKYPLTDITGAKLFGQNPVFVYDPNNGTNRPDEYAHPNVIARWPVFPPDLAAAFTKAFTQGLKDTDARITERQWLEALVKARGMLVRINGAETFVNAYDPKSLPKGIRLLKTDRQVTALADGSRLYKCQTDALSDDFKTVAGSARYNGAPVLYNNTAGPWQFSLNGSTKRVPPGACAELVPGGVINFGNTAAKIY